jgi:hypothetical protein
MPVALPPGRGRLSTKPSSTGSPAHAPQQETSTFDHVGGASGRNPWLDSRRAVICRGDDLLPAAYSLSIGVMSRSFRLTFQLP